MIHAGQTVAANPHGKKGFLIPVSWEVSDFVRVQADTLEEAYKWLDEHLDEVKLGTDPEYIDGSYQMASFEECEVYLDEAVDYEHDPEWEVQQDFAGYNKGHCEYMVVGVDRQKFLNWAVTHKSELGNVRFETGNGITVAKFSTHEKLPEMHYLVIRSFPDAIVYGIGCWDMPCIVAPKKKYKTSLENCFEDVGNLRIDVRVTDIISECETGVGDLICFNDFDDVVNVWGDNSFRYLTSLLNEDEKSEVAKALAECRRFHRS